MKEAIFVLSNPNAPRLCPELACEIGLNESIIFLQIEFWIRISNTEEHDGRLWTYQSVRKIKEFFPFWSIATINRAVQSIIDQKLITEGNFNRASYDRTRWFSINPEGVAKLKSIRLLGHDTPLYQNETRSNQNDTGVFQNETTIPETTTETTQENTDIAPTAPPANFTSVGNSYVNGAKLPASIKGGATKSKPVSRSVSYQKLAEHPGVLRYREMTGIFKIDKASLITINEGLGPHPTTEDLNFWEKVVQYYDASGWNKTNVTGMMDWYKRRELPHTGNGKANAPTREDPPDTGPATLEDVKRNNPALYERIMARQRKEASP